MTNRVTFARRRSWCAASALRASFVVRAGSAVRGRASRDAPVADAAMRGDTDGVRTLLRDGADVNAAQGDGMTALHWAALNGDLKTMNVLLVAGATTEPLTRVGALHAAAPRELARSRRRSSRGCSRPAASRAR